MKRAVVTKSTGKHYIIRDIENLNVLTAIIRGRLKQEELKLTNPIAVGDVVKYFVDSGHTSVITEIENRRNYIVRQSPRKKHGLHLLASNVDQAILIITIIEPNLKQGFIDRFLIMTEPYNIPVTIVFNKCDLYSEADLRMFTYLKNIYEKIGYQVLLSSAVDGAGISELKSMLSSKISLIGGQSGVGKTSLLNFIEPGLGLKTQEISDYSGKGQHTTTFAEMFELQFGGHIIDTPGIKTLSFNHLEVKDVAHNFREFFIESVNCKFANCTHREEPKCSVKKMIEEDEISELRYQNYLMIIDEIENQNYWERIKDY